MRLEMIRKGLITFVKRNLLAAGEAAAPTSGTVAARFSKQPSTYMSWKFYQSIYLMRVCGSAGIHKEVLPCSKKLNCSPHED